MGAWIETHNRIDTERNTWSHPTWVRGLKLELLVFMLPIQQSHPTWVRGLKQLLKTKEKLIEKSHPTWVRGLKHFIVKFRLLICVAPYMGAWIETSMA